MEAGLEGIDASDVSFLPIESTYARELGVVEEINRLCGRTKGVNAGQVCLALILDTLTGRSPLFRLEDSFAHLDVELLLGEGISVVQLIPFRKTLMPLTPKTLLLGYADTHGEACRKAGPPRIYGYDGSRIRQDNAADAYDVPLCIPL